MRDGRRRGGVVAFQRWPRGRDAGPAAPAANGPVVARAWGGQTAGGAPQSSWLQSRWPHGVLPLWFSPLPPARGATLSPTTVLVVLHRRSSGGSFVARRHHSCSLSCAAPPPTVDVWVIREGRPGRCRTRAGCGESRSTARTPRFEGGCSRTRVSCQGLVVARCQRDGESRFIHCHPLSCGAWVGSILVSWICLALSTRHCFLVVAPGLCPCPPLLCVTAVCWRDGAVWRRRVPCRGCSGRRRACLEAGRLGPAPDGLRAGRPAADPGPCPAAMIGASRRCFAACGGDWVQKQCRSLERLYCIHSRRRQ